MTEKIIQIKQRIQAARDQKKSYADLKRKPTEFQVGDRVMLKVSPWKGVVHFGKRGKLNPKYVGPFKVLENVGSVAYKIKLPQELSRVHNMFHVSNLKKCYADEPLAVPLDGLHFDDKLEFVEEPIEIMVCKVKRLKRSRFELFPDHKDHSEEEETKKMGEPSMEEYMTKTREGYGSGISRPKIDEKDQFELKGQFLKELRNNTFSELDNEDVNEHIEKVLKIVDLFHIPNITQDQVMLRVFPITAKKMEEINNFQQDPDETLYQACERFKELLLRCPQHYFTDMQEVISFYKRLNVPNRQILDSKGVIPSMKDADAKKAIQDMADHS
ncbi:hypothetical protein Tco_0524777 [Tanacetum coccineum]